MDKNIIISVKTILITALIGLGIYTLFRLGSTIGVVFIAILITVCLELSVKVISRQTFFNRPVSRVFAVLLTYLIFFLLLATLITIGLDPIINQSQKLIQAITQNQALSEFSKKINFSLTDIVSSFIATSGGVISATTSIFSNVAQIFSILILSIYMSLDWLNIKRKIISFFREQDRERVGKLFLDVEDNVGLWLRGEIILMTIIGIMSYAALALIGIEFAFALAVIAGMLEIVPIVGPVLTAVIASLVALGDSPVKALFVIGAFFIIQQTENNLLVPKVMQKVSGFSPVVILIALLIGGHLFGIVGAILTIPVLMISATVFKYLREQYFPNGNFRE